MKRAIRIASFAALGCVLLAATGCDEDQMLKTAPGRYAGFIRFSKAGVITQKPVAGVVTGAGEGILVLDVESAVDTGKWQYSVETRSDGRIRIPPGTGVAQAIVADRVSQKCFVTSEDSLNEGRPAARLCIAAETLTLEAFDSAEESDLILVLDKEVTPSHAGTEVPRIFQVDEIAKRAMDQSFEDRIGFARVVQAQLTARVARDLLLPHVNINDFITVETAGWQALWRSFSNLIPFAFLTRWIKAEQADLQATAAELGLLAARANSSSIAETLAWAVFREQRIIARYDAAIASMALIGDEILARVRSGQMPMVAAYQISAIVTNVEKARSVSLRLLQRERVALSQAAGFTNPDVVLSVTATLPTDENGNVVESPLPEFSIPELRESVVALSPELKQLDLFVDIARKEQRARRWQWVDPAGSPDGAIGINLVPFLQMGRAQVAGLMVQRAQTESVLLGKIADIVNDLQEYKRSRALAAQGLKNSDEIIYLHLLNLRAGTDFPMLELANALQEKVRNEIEIVSADALVAVALSQLDRMTFGGRYSGLRTGEKQK